MNLSVHISGFGQMFGVPNAVVDQYLKLATPSQLKVLLYLLRSNRPNLAHDEIAKALGIPEELVEEAVLFWSQTTLFTMEERRQQHRQRDHSHGAALLQVHRQVQRQLRRKHHYAVVERGYSHADAGQRCH